MEDLYKVLLIYFLFILVVLIDKLWKWIFNLDDVSIFGVLVDVFIEV